jgi:hypothetical protein
VERDFSPKASRLGVLARAGTNVLCPCGSAQLIQICRTTLHRIKLHGFSRTVLGGASEKCAEPSTKVHMPFTTFPQAPEMCNSLRNLHKNKENCVNKKIISSVLHKIHAFQPEEISGNFLALAIRPVKFVYPNWVCPDEQSLFLHKNHCRIQRFSFRRVNLIFGPPDSVLVEVH